MLRIRSLLVVLALATVAPACGHRPATRPVSAADIDTVLTPGTVLFPTAHPLPEVRAAIVRALADRNYATESEGTQEIIALQTARGASLRIAVSYTEQQAVIRYVDSTGLEVDERTNTAPIYARWVGFLGDSIRDQVASPPVPEVVEAVHTPPPTLAAFVRPQEPAAVLPMLQRAVTSHQWVIEQQLEGALLLRLDHGDHQLRLRCDYNATQANFVYVESHGLDFNAQGRNDEYERWMRNLVDAVQNASR